MPYSINKSDGTILVTLIDGTIDNSSSDLTLIGKNYTGFGEFINENFVKLLDNFSSVSAPTKAIEGQLWYDKSEGRLKIYSAVGWRGANGTVVADAQPVSLTTGDIWIDSKQKKMYFWDGSGLYETAKQWSDSQGKTGLIAETINDVDTNSKNILSLYVNGMLLGIFSKDTFTPMNKIDGWSGNDWDVSKSDYVFGQRVTFVVDKKPLAFEMINSFVSAGIKPLGDPLSSTYWKQIFIIPGFNTSGILSNYLYDTTVLRSKKLVDDQNNTFVASDFLKRTSDDVTTGKITIQNDFGLSLGLHQSTNLRQNGYEFIIENIAQGGNINIKTTNSLTETTAMYFDANNSRIGIFNSSPQKTLDVTGDVKISGSLQVATLSAAPSLPSNGMIYYDTNTNKFRGYANGSWTDLN